jgi:hypothetical protein
MNRTAFLSSWEHTLAVASLGSEYDAEEYLKAIETIRATGKAERYVDQVLGKKDEPDTDDGADVLKAAEADLRAHGIEPDSATYRQLAAALVRVSS